MGQKVNPIGLRLGINRGWDSVWFAKKKEYGKLLVEDYKIRDYIKKNIINSGVSQVIIERTVKKCIVSIYTSRPGFVIGKKGSDVDKIKQTNYLKVLMGIPILSLILLSAITIIIFPNEKIWYIFLILNLIFLSLHTGFARFVNNSKGPKKAFGVIIICYLDTFMMLTGAFYGCLAYLLGRKY